MVVRVGLAALALTLVLYGLALKEAIGTRNLHASWVIEKSLSSALTAAPLFAASLAVLAVGWLVLPRGGAALALAALLVGGLVIVLDGGAMLLMLAYDGWH